MDNKQMISDWLSPKKNKDVDYVVLAVAVGCLVLAMVVRYWPSGVCL